MSFRAVTFKPGIANVLDAMTTAAGDYAEACSVNDVDALNLAAGRFNEAVEAAISLIESEDRK